MRRQQGHEYEDYSSAAPLMMPLPRLLSRAISALFRLIRGRKRPELRRDLMWTFAIYLGLSCLLSVPFLILDWPPGGGWLSWPF